MSAQPTEPQQRKACPSPRITPRRNRRLTVCRWKIREISRRGRKAVIPGHHAVIRLWCLRSAPARPRPFLQLFCLDGYGTYSRPVAPNAVLIAAVAGVRRRGPGVRGAPPPPAW